MKPCKKQKTKTKIEKYSVLEDVRATAFKDGYIKGIKLGIALDIGCSKTKTSKAVLLQITCFFGGKTVSTRIKEHATG